MRTNYVGLSVIGCSLVVLLMGVTSVSATALLAVDTDWLEQCTSNCGFETGNMSGWMQSGGTFDVINYDAHSGTYSVRGTSATEAYFYRDVSINQYRSWIDSGYGTTDFGSWIDPGQSEDGKLQIRFLDQVGIDLGLGYSSGWTHQAGGYYYLNGQLSIPSGAYWVRLMLGAK